MGLGTGMPQRRRRLRRSGGELDEAFGPVHAELADRSGGEVIGLLLDRASQGAALLGEATIVEQAPVAQLGLATVPLVVGPPAVGLQGGPGDVAGGGRSLNASRSGRAATSWR